MSESLSATGAADYQSIGLFQNAANAAAVDASPANISGGGNTAGTDQVSLSSAARADQAQIAADQQAVTKADGTVAQDKANHSPGCVAVDQKIADRASLQLAQAKSAAQAAGVDVTV